MTTATLAPSVPVIEVRNPRYQPGHPDELERVTVVRAMRTDALVRLHHARRIDDCAYEAGRMMQALMEAAEVRGPRSVDTTQEPVDGGGGVPTIMSDRQFKAIKQLNSIYPVLGQDGYALVYAVLAKGMMPEQYGRAMGMTDLRDLNALGRELRRRLDNLAVVFGLAKDNGGRRAKHG